MKDFRKLKVWEKSHNLALAVYHATADFPKSEQYGLTSQMRRSASSIPSNIAEGSGRGGDVELARYLRIAMGSASELEYQLLLARDLNYLSEIPYKKLDTEINEIQKMITSFIKRLQANG